MNKKEIWINNKVIEWHSFNDGGSCTNADNAARAYQLWKHAESLISQNYSELHLVDAISTLKRCINQRLKFIEQVYSLNNISLPNSPKGYLEYLETFNVVRPFMLKKLMFIRNDIEHNDASPPDIERCIELLDLSWYFLKSTDNIVKVCLNSIAYKKMDDEGNETQYGFSLRIDFKLNYKINIWGWLPKDCISDKEIVNYSKVSIESIHNKADKWSESMYHLDKKDDDVFISGELCATNEVKHVIVKSTLEAY